MDFSVQRSLRSLHLQCNVLTHRRTTLSLYDADFWAARFDDFVAEFNSSRETTA